MPCPTDHKMPGPLKRLDKDFDLAATNGLPPKVVACEAFSQMSEMWRPAKRIPNGRPPAIPLANSSMSGITLYC